MDAGGGRQIYTIRQGYLSSMKGALFDYPVHPAHIPFSPVHTPFCPVRILFSPSPLTHSSHWTLTVFSSQTYPPAQTR